MDCFFLDFSLDAAIFNENFDLKNVITPVKSEVLAQLLREAGYDERKTIFLERGFTSGFNICYERPTCRQSEADNIPFTIGNHVVLWNKLMKELGLGRVAGPFEKTPFKNYIQSPIGLVLKAGGEQTRLIFHLSYNFKDDFDSVNAYTPKDKCSVNYHDLDYAVKTYLGLLKEAGGL